jgi:hypothetical protein
VGLYDLAELNGALVVQPNLTYVSGRARTYGRVFDHLVLPLFEGLILGEPPESRLASPFSLTGLDIEWDDC